MEHMVVHIFYVPKYPKDCTLVKTNFVRAREHVSAHSKQLTPEAVEQQ